MKSSIEPSVEQAEDQRVVAKQYRNSPLVKCPRCRKMVDRLMISTDECADCTGYNSSSPTERRAAIKQAEESERVNRPVSAELKRAIDNVHGPESCGPECDRPTAEQAKQPEHCIECKDDDPEICKAKEYDADSWCHCKCHLPVRSGKEAVEQSATQLTDKFYVRDGTLFVITVAEDTGTTSDGLILYDSRKAAETANGIGTLTIVSSNEKTGPGIHTSPPFFSDDEARRQGQSLTEQPVEPAKPRFTWEYEGGRRIALSNGPVDVLIASGDSVSSWLDISAENAKIIEDAFNRRASIDPSSLSVEQCAQAANDLALDGETSWEPFSQGIGHCNSRHRCSWS